MCFCKSDGIAANGLNRTGEDAPVGCGDRICGIDQIEVDGSVIGIDDDLYRITDVIEIETLRRLRIGKIVTRRIGILHPKQPSAADYQIRVMVEAEGWGDRAHPILDDAMNHDPTVGRDVAR